MMRMKNKMNMMNLYIMKMMRLVDIVDCCRTYIYIGLFHGFTVFTPKQHVDFRKGERTRPIPVESCYCVNACGSG